MCNIYAKSLDKYQVSKPKGRALRSILPMMAANTSSAIKYVEEAIGLISSLTDYAQNPVYAQVVALLNSARKDLRPLGTMCHTPSSTNPNKRGCSDSPMSPEGIISRSDIQELKDFIEQCHDRTRGLLTGVKSYAGVLSGGNSQSWRSFPAKQVPEQRIAIRVEKSDRGVKLKGKTIAETLSTIQCLNEGPIGVDTVQKPDHLILRVRSSDDCDLIKKELETAGCNVRILKKRFPQLKILHVPATTTDKELEDDLKRKNPEFNNPEVKAVGARKNHKDASTKTVILQVTTDIADKYLKRSGRIYLKHQTHPVILDDQLVQCWNCRMFGHTAKHCDSQSTKNDINTLCPKCGEKHPKDRQCDTYNCINCRRENEKGKNRPGRKPLDTKHSCNNFKACGVAKKYRDSVMSTIYGS